MSSGRYLPHIHFQAGKFKSTHKRVQHKNIIFQTYFLRGWVFLLSPLPSNRKSQCAICFTAFITHMFNASCLHLQICSVPTLMRICAGVNGFLRAPEAGRLGGWVQFGWCKIIKIKQWEKSFHCNHCLKYRLIVWKHCEVYTVFCHLRGLEYSSKNNLLCWY